MHEFPSGDGVRHPLYTPEDNKDFVQISKNNSAELIARAGEIKQLAVVDLIDATALGLIVDKNDGTKVGYIQQFDFGMGPIALKKLNQNVQDYKLNSIGRIQALILLPFFGENADSTRDKSYIEAFDTAQLLSQELLWHLGPAINVGVTDYFSKNYGESSSLMIELSSNDSSGFYLNGNKVD